jgi:hypothetical protein
MPSARIDVSKDAPPERIKVVSEAIYSAMAELANVACTTSFKSSHVTLQMKLSIQKRDTLA